MGAGEKEVPPLREFAVSALASSTSGIISRIFCHPLDTCKARLQAPGSQFKTVLEVIRATVREEGFLSLYRGMGTVVLIGTPAFVVYLATYEATKKKLVAHPALKDYEFVGHFVSGMVAETVSCLVFVPVDVVKERLQVQRLLKSGQEVPGSLPMYRGTWHALTTIMRQEGVRGVYKGYAATLLSYGPYSAFYFLFWEKFKSTFARFTNTTTETLPFHYTVVSAASAGALASWITTPVDLVRLRLQVQRGSKAASLDASAPEPYRNTMDGVSRILRSEGPRGLFKGALARIAFHTPLTMISMSLYDECKKIYAHYLEQGTG